MYSRILVTLDGSDLSEHVLPYAITLGLALDCPIELLRIPENLPLYAAGDFESVSAAYQAMSPEERKAECQEYLDDIAGPLREKGLRMSTLVRSGMAAHEIVAESALIDQTVVAMASHGRSGIARWILGSVADEVLRKSTSHLLLVRPREDGEAMADAAISRIIMPLDGSSLAEQALVHMTGLAKSFAAKVDLVRVTPSATEYYRQASLHPAEGSSIQYVPPYEEVSKDLDEKAQAYLEKVQAKLEERGLSMVEIHSVHGHPAGVISDMARSEPGSMVVISTHGRSGIGRWVLGSVADSVARHSGCAVLLIRAQ